jgi:6-phosphogluconolactonase (cycloisomerase 2 family)
VQLRAFDLVTHPGAEHGRVAPLTQSSSRKGEAAMKELTDHIHSRAPQRSFLIKKSQAGVLCLASILRIAEWPSLALLMALAVLCTVQTPAWGAGGTDVIWLESNSTAGNSILAFKNTGTASPIFLGSTPAGGIGVFDKTFALGPFDSDQNLIVNEKGTLLFAVNSGSNSIAVFRITPHGLQLVEGSPFASGGSDPVSVGLKGDILAVVNKDQDPAQNANLVLPNYTTFRVSPDGKLTAVENSTVFVAYNSSPSQALTAFGGDIVFGADFFGGLLQSLRIDEDGRLHQNPPQALPNSVFADQTAGHQPLGMRTHPNLPILYVDITPISEVAVYRYDEKGVLSFVRAVSDSGAAPCWAVVNHTGTRLYVTNTGDNSIAVYDLTDPLNPEEIQHFVMDATTGAAFSTVIDQSDEWLYVSSEQSSSTATPAANAFHTLKVAPDGTLTEPFSPTVLPIDGTVPVRAQGITVFGTK